MKRSSYPIILAVFCAVHASAGAAQDAEEPTVDARNVYDAVRSPESGSSQPTAQPTTAAPVYQVDVREETAYELAAPAPFEPVSTGVPVSTSETSVASVEGEEEAPSPFSYMIFGDASAGVSANLAASGRSPGRPSLSRLRTELASRSLEATFATPPATSARPSMPASVRRCPRSWARS